jgi:hypothetical protein
MMLEPVGHQSTRRQKMVSSQLPLLLAMAAAALIAYMARAAADIMPEEQGRNLCGLSRG